MASVISICSNALLLLGDSTISSLDEDSDRARLCSNLYESTRDAVVRGHPWNCCVKRVLLPALASAPPFPWGSSWFQVPHDFVRVLSVGTECNYMIPYILEGRHIIAAGQSLPLRYIWSNDDPDTWDGMLVKAMELAMAAELAYPITKDKGEQELREQLLDRFMKRARSVNGQENPAMQVGDERLYMAGF